MSDSTKGGIDMHRSSIAEQPIKNAPTPEEIRQRAYEIHIERGGLYGCDMDDLLQAERELQKSTRTARSNESFDVSRTGKASLHSRIVNRRLVWLIRKNSMPTTKLSP